MTSKRYTTLNRVFSGYSNFFLKLFLFLPFLLLNACQTTGIFGVNPQPLQNIQVSHFFVNASDSVIGQLASVESQEGETLPDIARHFSLGFNEIKRANKNLKVWQLSSGSQVKLPLKFILPKTPREGVVMNLANMRLFYFPPKQDASSPNSVMSFPVGIGKKGWTTPLGTTKIVQKKIAPDWYVPVSIRREHAKKGDPLPAVVKAGPNNPLGHYAMRLGFPGYLIHGTNKPYGVGLRVSHGCVRLYPEDIAELFAELPVGVKVRIVDQPYLMGWRGNSLYLSAHAKKIKANHKKQLIRKLKKKLRQNPDVLERTIDWQQVDNILAEATGVPLPVLKAVNDYGKRPPHYPLVNRPDKLFGIPVVPELTPGSWSILAARFSQSEPAEILSAMLNHQGPQIPSRVLGDEPGYKVVAGPFKDQSQARKAAKRMKREFELDVQIQKTESVIESEEDLFFNPFRRF